MMSEREEAIMSFYRRVAAALDEELLTQQTDGEPYRYAVRRAFESVHERFFLPNDLSVTDPGPDPNGRDAAFRFGLMFGQFLAEKGIRLTLIALEEELN